MPSRRLTKRTAYRTRGWVASVRPAWRCGSVPCLALAHCDQLLADALLSRQDALALVDEGGEHLEVAHLGGIESHVASDRHHLLRAQILAKAPPPGIRRRILRLPHDVDAHGVFAGPARHLLGEIGAVGWLGEEATVQ